MMGFTISQLGIMIAAVMILAALSTIFFDSSWQKKQEMRQIAQQISSSLISIDKAWYETTNTIPVSKEFQGYNITMSSSSIKVSSFQSNEQIIWEKMMVHPLIRTYSDEWSTANQLHIFLYQTYGHQGTKEDPIPENSDIYSYFTNEVNNSNFVHSLHPYVIDTSMQITLEKVLIYFDENKDGIWEKTEHILDYTLLSQCSD